MDWKQERMEMEIQMEKEKGKREDFPLKIFVATA
jgi:hypothetical protein